MTVPIGDTEEVITFDWHSVQELWSVPATDVDSSTSTEDATIGAELAAVDVSTGAETASVVQEVMASDVAAGADTATLVELSSTGDTGVAADVAQLDITSGDSASTAEAVALAYSIVVSEDVSCSDDQDRRKFQPPYNIIGTRTLAANTFDGGTSGHDIAVINSGRVSGNPFSTVQRGVGTTLKYDSTQSWHGGQSMKFKSDSTANYSYVEWDESSIGASEDIYARFYFRFAAIPPYGMGHNLIAFDDTTSGSNAYLYFANLGTGTAYEAVVGAKSSIPNGSGGYTLGAWILATNYAMLINTWYRVELHIRFSPANDGVIEIYTFQGDKNFPPGLGGFSTLTVGVKHGATALNRRCDRVRLGMVPVASSTYGTGAADFPDIWIDDFAVSNVDWVGVSAQPRYDVEFATATDYASLIQKAGTDTASCVDFGQAAELYADEQIVTAVETEELAVTGTNEVSTEETVLVDDSGMYEDA